MGKNNSKQTNKTDQELIFKIYKHLNTRKINDPIKKMGQRTKQTFIQRRHTVG